MSNNVTEITLNKYYALNTVVTKNIFTHMNISSTYAFDYNYYKS